MICLMSMLVPVIMFGWIPLVIGLFAVLPPRRAAIAAFLFAWLFLPNAGYVIGGLPDYTKVSATSLGVLLGTVLFASGRLLKFRPSLLDLAMVVWCLVPLASSLDNDLGLYDGLSASLGQTVTWGVPYLLGRVYISDLEGLRELAIGIFIGGVIYIPLILFENRMSPQLHGMVYGLGSGFRQYEGFGGLGWQPWGFFQNALALTMFMAGASLIGVWLWATGSLRRLWGVSMAWLVLAVAAATILCKSLGANVLVVVCIVALLVTRWFGTKVLLVCLLAVGPAYITLRLTDLWTGQNAVEFISNSVSEARAGSLQVRLDNEVVLARHALEQPYFGWGGWGRNRVYDENGQDTTLTDGMWVIALGQNGFVGMLSFVGFLLLPFALLLWRLPLRDWWSPRCAPAAALATLLGAWMFDNLMNAMVNPILTLAAGGVAGFAAALCRSVLTKPMGEWQYLFDPSDNHLACPKAKGTNSAPG